MSKTSFPITVKRGNVRVKIYRGRTRGCWSYTVAYYDAGGRRRTVFAELDKARQEAELVATKIAQGELDVLELRSDDRLAYTRATQLLQPAGTPLEVAVMQFVEATKHLEGASLVEAAKFYHKHHRQVIRKKTVAEVVAEVLAARESEGCSPRHVAGLRTHLERFAAAFPTPIGMVLAPEIQSYLRELRTAPDKRHRRSKNGFVSRPQSAKSKNNVRKSIQNLFRFARSRGYLPKGPTEADEVSAFKTPVAEIGIFTPAEMTRLLEHGADLVPFLAIGAFAGLRHAEILRLDWREVDLEGGHIEVKAKKAKTGTRRLVPVTDNLKAWLRPYHDGEGRVIKLQQVDWRLPDLARAAKVTWKHNALRHSFISYRVAAIQNVAQVALEAGNSPKIIFSNYRELVKSGAAAEWFGIRPETTAVKAVRPRRTRRIIELQSASLAA
ncbi:tyrosine-type recombinase/integrase [bacterium]|nr:tyrosine-type recombinase/integrase [bacterium]